MLLRSIIDYARGGSNKDAWLHVYDGTHEDPLWLHYHLDKPRHAELRASKESDRVIDEFDPVSKVGKGILEKMSPVNPDDLQSFAYDKTRPS